MPASDLLQSVETNNWRTKPFATRLVAPDRRTTLTRDAFKTSRYTATGAAKGDVVESRPVAPGEWNQLLVDEFGIDDPVEIADQ